MKLNELTPGTYGRVTEVAGSGALRQHFLDMGLIPGSVIMLEKFAPMGDPIEFRIYGYELTLRVADAAQITVEPAKPVPTPAPKPHNRIEHPGLGETGRYHSKDH